MQQAFGTAAFCAARADVPQHKVGMEGTVCQPLASNMMLHAAKCYILLCDAIGAR